MDLMKEIKIYKDIIQEMDKKISNIDALKIAVQIQNNRILANGLVVGNINAKEIYPTALEAIAMCLGMSENCGIPNFYPLENISSSIEEIRYSIESINEKMTNQNE